MLTKTKMVAVAVLAIGVVFASGCKHTPKRHACAESVPVTDTETLVGGTGETEQFSNVNENENNSLVNRDVYHFAYDSSDINEEDRLRIKHHGAHLANKNKAKVRLEGHADPRGSHEYNVALGHRRANSVQRELQAQGTQSQQIETVSYGSERPAAKGSDEEAYQQNRRVELSYIEGAPQNSEVNE